MALTGRRDLRDFWKMSPAELLSWCEAAGDDEDSDLYNEIYGDAEDEVID